MRTSTPVVSTKITSSASSSAYENWGQWSSGAGNPTAVVGTITSTITGAGAQGGQPTAGAAGNANAANAANANGNASNNPIAPYKGAASINGVATSFVVALAAVAGFAFM